MLIWFTTRCETLQFPSLDCGGERVGEPCEGSGFEELSCWRNGLMSMWRMCIRRERESRVVRVIEGREVVFVAVSEDIVRRYPFRKGRWVLMTSEAGERK
jgi:hypothetical protein